MSRHILPRPDALKVIASLVVGFSSSAYAATYVEVEPNSTCAAAQDLQSAAIPLEVTGIKSADDNALDFFKFHAAPGTQMRAILNGTMGALGPGLGLFASNCGIQTSNFPANSSRPAQLDFTVGADGVFILAVTACCDMGFTGSGTISGPYVLSVQMTGSPPDPLAEFIAPIDSTPAGRTYGQWASAYWQWVLGVPENKLPRQSGSQRENPLNDLTGQSCGEHQIGDVWFLAGSWVGTVTRSCSIPAGKSLFFPFINNAYLGFLSDPPDQRTEKYAHDNAGCTQPVVISATLDGQEIRDPLRYSTAPSASPSPSFNVQMPFGIAQGGPGNLFESLGYKIKQIPEWFLSPSAEQGYYLFLKPLPPGPHTLQWSASGCTEGATQDITYYITVLDQ